MFKFDIFKDNPKKLEKYIRQQQAKLKEYEQRMASKSSEHLNELVLKNVDNMQNVSTGSPLSEVIISMNEIKSNNVIERIGVTHYKIKNHSEEATYAEFGTGVIGEGTPYPNNDFGWEYDVNEHGEKGWRYIGVDGSLVHTLGYPAFATYYISFNELKDDLDDIAKREFKEVFGHEE